MRYKFTIHYWIYKNSDRAVFVCFAKNKDEAIDKLLEANNRTIDMYLHFTEVVSVEEVVIDRRIRR